MNRRQIAYFLAVADAESFSRAAVNLHVSQSALSARIAELETGLSTKLFERHPHGVSLTAGGRRFLPYAQDIAGAFETAQQAMATEAETELPRPLRIGVTPTIGATFLPAMLKATRLTRPPLELLAKQASSSRLVEMLASDEIEAALCYADTPPPRFRALMLYRDDMALVGSRKTMGEDTADIAFNAVSGYGLVLDPLSHPSRQAVEAAVSSTGVRLQVRAEIEPLSAKRMLVVDHGLCTIIPPKVFGAELLSGSCVARRIISPRLSIRLTLMMRDNLDPKRSASLHAAVKSAIVGSRVEACDLRTGRRLGPYEPASV